MIVRDASATLSRCLQSIQYIADEIIIVDTGSKDNTLEIARQFTQNVFLFEWIDDFAAARNFAVSKAGGDWILNIDADKYLLPAARGYLPDLLGNPDVVAYSCKIRNNKDYTFENACFCLFRNQQNLYYTGLINEKPDQSIALNIQETGLKTLPCNLCVEHSGWEGDKTPKYDRDLKLLKLAIDKEPENADLWNRLAMIHRQTGEMTLAKSANQKACNLIIDQKNFTPHEANIFALAVKLTYNDAGFRDEIIEIALKHYPNNPSFFFAKAKSLIRHKAFDRAIEIFNQLIEMGKTQSFDQTIAHPLNIFDELAYGGIADCNLSLKNFSEAAFYFEKALAFTAKPEYRVKYNLSKNLAK